MMNRNIKRVQPVHHFHRGIGRKSLSTIPEGKKAVHSPTAKRPTGERLNHNSPYPFYYYKRLVFNPSDSLSTINIQTRMNEALVLKSITVHYAESYIGTDDNGTPFDGRLFNRKITAEVFKVENNRKTSNKPLPVELFCQVGRFGTQVVHGTSENSVLTNAEFKGYVVAPVAPYNNPVYDLKKGNSMALDELTPSNGNLFINVYSEIENDSFVPSSPLCPMAVDVILKAVCVPNVETLYQKAY